MTAGGSRPVERPFVAEPVGDQDRALAVARTAASALGLPDLELLRVGMNALFRSGGVVLRVGRPSADAALAIRLAERLLQLGVPVVPPASDLVTEADGLVVTAWAYVEAADRAVDWAAVGEVVRRVHDLDRADLPPGYPVPSPAGFPWWDFDGLLADVAAEIDAEALGGLMAAVERHRGWEEMSSVVVCHGDVHPGNVLMTAEGAVLLDWDLLCAAAPGWDHAMLLTLEERWGGEPGTYAAFAEGYGRSLADDPETVAFAELRNVAATLMRVRAGRTDPAAAGEAERRLRFWRGDSDAPVWCAQ